MVWNRRLRKAAASAASYWRLTPLFKDEKGEMVEGLQTYVVQNEPKDVRVVVLPAGAISLEFAQNKEQELTTLLQCDVIVTSPNVQFMKIEKLSAKEVADAFPKGVPTARLAPPGKPVVAPVDAAKILPNAAAALEDR